MIGKKNFFLGFSFLRFKGNCVFLVRKFQMINIFWKCRKRIGYLLVLEEITHDLVLSSAIKVSLENKSTLDSYFTH